MRILFPLIFILLIQFPAVGQSSLTAWIRVNQLGYTRQGNKAAVFVSKEKIVIAKFELINARTTESVLARELGNDFGAYGPFVSSYRLDFSACKTSGIQTL